MSEATSRYLFNWWLKSQDLGDYLEPEPAQRRYAIRLEEGDAIELIRTDDPVNGQPLSLGSNYPVVELDLDLVEAFIAAEAAVGYLQTLIEQEVKRQERSER